MRNANESDHSAHKTPWLIGIGTPVVLSLFPISAAGIIVITVLLLVWASWSFWSLPGPLSKLWDFFITPLAHIYGIAHMSWDMPRRVYLKELAVIVGIRYIAFLFIFTLVAWWTSPPGLLFSAALSLFLVPYFVLICRRLRTLAVPCPALATCLLVFALLAFLGWSSSNSGETAASIRFMDVVFASFVLMCMLAVFAVLLAVWPLPRPLAYVYGIARMPKDMPRRAFLKEAALVMGIRYVTIIFLYILLVRRYGPFASEQDEALPLLLFSIITTLFFVPYFVLICRRLRTIRAPHPVAMTWILFFIATLIAELFPSSDTLLANRMYVDFAARELTDAALYAAFLALLALWPDPRIPQPTPDGDLA